MKLSEELIYRGMAGQHTFDAPTDLDKKKHKFYFGVDPSDSSMTIGNLAALMMCRVFVRHGYDLTLLVGGGTGLIGDPKMDKERPIKPLEEIERNAKGIVQQFNQLMGSKIKVVNNYDWLSGLGFFQFSREVGRHFSMTQLLDRDFVKARTGEGGSGLSVAEFSYSLLQGYDFLHLYRTYGIDLQLCGADQIGNCMSGVHLINKSENARGYVWSCPLVIDKVSGRKFGKSEGNAVWLDPERTSPYEYYQFWLNTNDESVGDLLKIYTEIEPTEINEILSLHEKNPGARGAQKALALAATEILHGRETAVNVARVSNVLFGGENVRELPAEGLKLLSEVIPTVPKNITAVEALVKSGLATSNGEALRLIRGNAISVSGTKISADTKITELSLIKKGKNQFVIVK